MQKVLFFILGLASIAVGETFELITPNYEIQDNRVKIEGFGSVLESGNPWMPAKAVWIIVPSGSEITNCKVRRKLQPLPDKYSIISAPHKLTEGRLLKKIDSEQETYPIDIYPSIAGKYLGTHNFIGYTLAKVVIFPFAYNSITQELQYSPNVIINFNYTTPAGSIKVDTTLDNILCGNVLNFEQKGKWYKPNPMSSHNYVIVADRSLIPILHDFIEWKESIGYKVKVVSPMQIEDRARLGGTKYILVIGSPEESQKSTLKQVQGKGQKSIVGVIPYTEPNIVRSILERTIEFELNQKKKTILFVSGIANYENENFPGVPAEDKTELLRDLESLIPMDWEFEELSGEVIQGDYSIINFLTLGKNWLYDDGDEVPDDEEIRVSSYSLFDGAPSLVFAPFAGAKFLKEGAVCVVAPESSSQYIVGWNDSLDGGNQSFNYMFLKYLMDKEIVGDAFLMSKFWYETYFPYDTLSFEIWGDPSLNLHGIPAVDIGITSTPVKWIPPDTEFSPSCKVLNFGRMAERNCKIYCEIVKQSGVSVYSQSVVIDTIKPMEERLVKFPKWNDYEIGVDYKVQFYLFSPLDEEPKNDTLSTIVYVAAGDFILVGNKQFREYRDCLQPPKDGYFLHSTLTELGYKGVCVDELENSLYPWIKNFSSIFLSDMKDIDSFPPIRNIYIEDVNLWLSKLLSGKKISAPIEFPIFGMGFSFSPSVKIARQWFIPEDCIPIFTDSRGEVTGFCYQNSAHKIWCNRFKLSEVGDSIKFAIIDSVMNFFEVSANKEAGHSRLGGTNITIFESIPNPFYDKTYVKFKIEKTPSKINLSIYNLAGTRVKELVNEFLGVGEYEKVWDGSDEAGGLVVNGIYFLRLQSEEQSQLIKLIVFR